MTARDMGKSSDTGPESSALGPSSATLARIRVATDGPEARTVESNELLLTVDDVEEAWHRLGQPDMAQRHGAEIVRQALRRLGLG